MLPTSNGAEKVTYGYGYMPLFLYVCSPPHSLVAVEAMKHQSISVDGSKSDPLKSRQSSAKWIPTNEQARILRDLYHNHGVRSPNVEQIQKISSRLRQYGKIEGKNVFYWFSNYKARERRKRRLSVDFPSSSSSSNTTTTPGADATCASPGLHAVGQMGSCECPGSVLTEKSYKGYFMSRGGGEAVLERNRGWATGLEPPAMSHYTRVQKAKTTHAETRTLPLFPIHTPEQEKVEEEEHQEGKQREERGVRSSVAGTPQQPKPIGRIPAFNLDDGRQRQEDHCCLELTLDSYHHVPLRST